MPPSFKNFYTGIGHKTGKNAPPDAPSLPAAPHRSPSPRRMPCFPPVASAASAHTHGAACAGRASAAQAYYAGVPGASAPGEIKYKVSPLPRRGRGVGGSGQNLYDTLKINPASKTPKPPPDALFRALTQRRPGSYAWAPPAPVEPAPPRLRPGDARGEAPCIRKPKVSPFPGGEERSASAGRGDGGRKVNERQGRWQAAKKASPPPGTLFPALNQRRAGLLRRGAGGVSPRRNKV